MPKCKGCGREIIWGRTPEGKSIPLDTIAPVYVTHPQGGSSIVRHSTAWVSHFATCPKASEFSGSRKKKEEVVC